MALVGVTDRQYLENVGVPLYSIEGRGVRHFDFMSLFSERSPREVENRLAPIPREKGTVLTGRVQISTPVSSVSPILPVSGSVVPRTTQDVKAGLGTIPIPPSVRKSPDAPDAVTPTVFKICNSEQLGGRSSRIPRTRSPWVRFSDLTLYHRLSCFALSPYL